MFTIKVVYTVKTSHFPQSCNMVVVFIEELPGPRDLNLSNFYFVFVKMYKKFTTILYEMCS